MKQIYNIESKEEEKDDLEDVMTKQVQFMSIYKL